jgi:hypothetical protein
LTATVNAHNPAQTDLTITGSTTSGSCDSITVVVSDENRNTHSTGTPVISGSQWTATLNGTAVQCGDIVLVTPHCHPNDGEPCTGLPVKLKVSCTGQCPSLKDLQAAVSTSCNADGTRTVTLSALVTLAGSGSVQVQWQYETQNFSQETTISATGTTQTTYNYLPGDYVAVLIVTTPAGCASQSVKFHVPDCPAPPASGCPTLKDLNAAVSSTCNADGTRTVTLSAMVTLTGSGSVEVQWQYDTQNFSQATTISATGTTQTTYNYAPGTYAAHLLVTTPTGCPSALVKFHVPECPVPGCPTLSDPAVQAAADCNADGTRTVTLSATVTLPGSAAVWVIWDYGDNNDSMPTEVSASGSIQTTHDYQPGSYGAQLQVLPPTNCPPLMIGVTVQPCIPCPTLGQGTAQYGDCNADGTRTVTLSVSLSGGVGSTVTWDFGDGNYSAPITVTSSGSATVTHNYDPGSYNPTLSVTNPSVCGASVELSIDVPSCTPATCPNVTNLTASLSSGCAGQGNTVTATFSGTVSPPPAAGTTIQFEWDFGDGSPSATSNSPSITHAYSSSGTFPVGVVTICGDCVTQATLDVIIPPCCAVVESLGVTVTGCVGSETSVIVTLVATMNTSPAAGTFTWNFGDGSSATTAAPAVIHNYTTAGSFSASVSFQPADSTCPSSSASASVSVPACGPSSGGKGNGGGSSGPCGALLVAAISLLLLGGLLIILGICLAPVFPPAAPVLEIAGGIAAGIGLILFIIWAAICAAFTSCGLMQTIYCLLVWLVGVVIPIACVVMFLMGDPPCALATAITGVAWGSILVWYGFIMDKVKCLRKLCF